MKDRKSAVFMIEVRGAPHKPRTLFNSHMHRPLRLSVKTFAEHTHA